MEVELFLYKKCDGMLTVFLDVSEFGIASYFYFDIVVASE